MELPGHVSAIKFYGRPVRQVQQPGGSELCFAAMAAAILEVDIPEADLAIRQDGLCDPEGKVGWFMKQQNILVGSGCVIIDPLPDTKTGDADAEEVAGLIDAEHSQGTPVALLHKKNDDPGDNQYHWLLVTGQWQNIAGRTLAYGIMDPLNERHTQMDPEQLKSLVNQSQSVGGVLACGLTVLPPPLH